MRQLSLFDMKGRPPDTHSKTLEQVRIFDNRGKTFDRYFVVINKEAFTMSHNPMSPQGVNQYMGPDETTGRPWNVGGGALGIPLDHIPPGIEPAILERIKDMED